MKQTKHSLWLLLALFILVWSCQPSSQVEDKEKAETKEEERPLAKYEPADGQVLLFVGQELESIGGLEEYNDGYMDHFPRPGGFTMYTKIRPGDEEFGFTYSGPSGVFTTDDWGDSPSNMSLQIADPDFENMALAIGFEMVNHEGAIARGEHDSLVLVLGEWLKSLAPRPVFLRIGYEFSGAWNHYNREEYIQAYQRIHELYDSIGVENVAYVWQSHGWEEPMDLLKDWYPGDEYVDWCGYSHFARWDEVNMIEFAKQRGKPVFVAEATPTLGTETVKTNGKTRALILSDPEQGEIAWNEWFLPFFKTIDDHPETIKAISYINCNWKSHRMWFENPTFQDVDARLQSNEMIAQKWLEETSKEKYLKASDRLYEALGVGK